MQQLPVRRSLLAFMQGSDGCCGGAAVSVVVAALHNSTAGEDLVAASGLLPYRQAQQHQLLHALTGVYTGRIASSCPKCCSACIKTCSWGRFLHADHGPHPVTLAHLQVRQSMQTPQSAHEPAAALTAHQAHLINPALRGVFLKATMS